MVPLVVANADNSYLFVNRKGIYKFKTSIKNNSFPSPLSLGSISHEFDSDDFNKVFKDLNGNVYDFSVAYSAIDKCNILNIHKYLVIKNSI